MQGVNARIAEKIVREHEAWYPSVDRLHALVLDWVKAEPALPTYDRDQQSDDEVRLFIRDRVRAGGAISKTATLRALRESGRACEQTRFGRLYKDVVDGSATGAAPRMSSKAGDVA